MGIKNDNKSELEHVTVRRLVTSRARQQGGVKKRRSS